jgi:hypothetical protein
MTRNSGAFFHTSKLVCCLVLLFFVSFIGDAWVLLVNIYDTDCDYFGFR